MTKTFNKTMVLKALIFAVALSGCFFLRMGTARADEPSSCSCVSACTGACGCGCEEKDAHDALSACGCGDKAGNCGGCCGEDLIPSAGVCGCGQ